MYDVLRESESDMSTETSTPPLSTVKSPFKKGLDIYESELL